MLCFGSKFFNQRIERREILAGELPFTGIHETACDGFLYKRLLSTGIGTRAADLNTLNGAKNLFETWNKADILNIQNNLRHNTAVLIIPFA